MTDYTTTVPVPTLSEVVIKTGRFDLLKDWYSKALCTEPFFTRPRPPETSWTGAQQIAFYKLPGEYPFAQVFGIFEVVKNIEIDFFKKTFFYSFRYEK